MIFTISKDYYLLLILFIIKTLKKGDFIMRLLDRIFGICQFKDLSSNI